MAMTVDEKSPNIFPAEPLFVCFFVEMFIKLPQFHEISPALKNFWLHVWTLTKSMSMNIWVIVTLNQLFIRAS